ncbi:uncharacterized protein EV422DRAFT_419526 [Fimicolochytrium jonesii]|uniref:uncharacterized protein n=1 Tax=Fimicolochytrium jonesii TaxID=1396493 RepID=UPI0022FEAC6D|nr:uncharacterized protein EV422DRAFT_419526 [Fimicolochytrium jonesii]KAI8822162.1 hypothetical protein EV422DRAFT_419526 [Fimicolochytrium jonesii]
MKLLAILLVFSAVFVGVVHGLTTRAVCDTELGCGAGCHHACPFGFPCRSAADCLSESCTGGYCDIGRASTSPGSASSAATPQNQAWELPDLKDGLKSLNIVQEGYGQDNRAVVPDPSGGGKQVLKVSYPMGSYNPAGSISGGTRFYAKPADVSTATVLSLEYQVYFPLGFEFVKGGRLPGIYGGRTACYGGDNHNDCFSTRYYWRKGGVGEIYVYVNSADQVDAFCEVPPLSTCNGAYGNSIGRGAFSFKAGSWQSVVQRITLNTPGKADGRVQVFSNGQEVIDFDKIVWRDAEDIKFEGIVFESFFGGADASWATPKDQTIYFRGLSMHWE